MTNRLSEKVCVITGTGGGMGREAALAFAREGALVVGSGLYVEDAAATVAAVRAADRFRIAEGQNGRSCSGCSEISRNGGRCKHLKIKEKIGSPG
jgi:NAD(P)-dependent dehydrogenase (short-subunit alcohol dehydrogenase family)